ncbi:sugar transferase [candidate division KSB1 bacterium]
MIKRLFDILFSFIFLLLLSPLFLLIALAIKISSKGGVIFRQNRLGMEGSLFVMYKFRSMVPGADKEGSHLTGKNDSRITGFGKILRKTKLDELPQLYNVLKGDMSVVGPRPEVEDFKDLYTGVFSRILDIRPGITDYASIYYIEEEKILPEEGRDKFYIENILPDKLKIQLEYVEKQSFFYDIKVIFLTIFSLLFKQKKKSFIDAD